MTDPFELNLRHLDAVAVIARLGSVSSAAAEINLSQPALTQGLAKLERRLGARLFVRQSAGVATTEAGAILARRVQRMSALLDEAERLIRRGSRGGGAGHVARRIAMTQLRAVIAVERSQSFGVAAAELEMSQPSVHRATRDLERTLKVPLFTREGRAIRSTGAARSFVRSASLAVAELRAALDELLDLTVAGSGTIVVGAMPLARSVLLPRTIARFCRDQPRARLRVVEGPYGELLSGLEAGRIDLLIGALRTPTPTRDIVQRPLFDAPLVIVGRSSHPLAGTVAPDADAFSRYPWVVAPPGAPLRTQWEAMFQPGQPPWLGVECSSVMAIRGLLLEDDWLTLLSPDQFKLEQESGVLTTIGPPLAGSERHIGVTTRADWRPTRLQSLFLDCLSAAVKAGTIAHIE